MARQAVKVLNPILKKSLNLFSKTEEATTGDKWAAGLDAGAKGYGATDSSVDALLA